MAECIISGRQGPKGDTGARGPTGATGPQGPTGPAGSNGSSLFTLTTRSSGNNLIANGALCQIQRGATWYYVTLA